MMKFVQVAMIAVLAVGGAALAQDASDAGGTGNPGSAAPAPSPAPAPENKASNRLLRGDVESVDIEAKTMTVKAKKRGEMVTVVVETNAKTQFIVNDAPGTLVDIRKGMSVTVLPDVGIATKVTAKAAKPAPKRTRGSTTRPSHG